VRVVNQYTNTSEEGKFYTNDKYKYLLLPLFCH